MHETPISKALQTEDTGEMDMAPTSARAVGLIPANYFLSHRSTWGELKKVALRMSRHFESDHQAIVAILCMGKKQKLKAYQRRRHILPIWLCKYGPRSETKTMFKELQAT